MHTTRPLTSERARRLSLPALLLRLESAAILIGAIALYADAGWSWLAFVGLLIAPDISLLALAVNDRLGAVLYDVVHNYTLPVALGVVSLLADASLGVQIATVWIAHIGMDRQIGYGLRYPSNSKETHLQRL